MYEKLMKMKTTCFKIVTGVNSGYGHSNEIMSPLQIVGETWQKIAEEEFAATGTYVSAVAASSKTIYSSNWGCPVGGEDTVTLTGSANPEFVQDLESWKGSVLSVAKKLKEELLQSTMTVEFFEVNDFIYLV